MFTFFLSEGAQFTTSSQDRVILERLDTWIVDEVFVGGVTDVVHLAA